ncbi:hypothetical protein [Nostoc sp. FACHB-280]|uniref:hypothetical protein n=1 Tax=Nostoc sp. FACHB-280 TaxID=2692839 RepID=UPI00168B1839|nr:hypothetical protein [Nostoc sp. FACHB-280]MBD2493544.1 hypothetical protein [Nostoc sp. FACHB-280]
MKSERAPTTGRVSSRRSCWFAPHTTASIVELLFRVNSYDKNRHIFLRNNTDEQHARFSQNCVAVS